MFLVRATKRLKTVLTLGNTGIQIEKNTSRHLSESEYWHPAVQDAIRLGLLEPESTPPKQENGARTIKCKSVHSSHLQFTVHREPILPGQIFYISEHEKDLPEIVEARRLGLIKFVEVLGDSVFLEDEAVINLSEPVEPVVEEIPKKRGRKSKKPEKTPSKDEVVIRLPKDVKSPAQVEIASDQEEDRSELVETNGEITAPKKTKIVAPRKVVETETPEPIQEQLNDPKKNSVVWNPVQDNTPVQKSEDDPRRSSSVWDMNKQQPIFIDRNTTTDNSMPENT